MQFKKVLFIKVSTKVSTCLHTLRERKLLLLTSEMRVNAKVKDENLVCDTGRTSSSYENLNMALASLSDDKFTSAEVKRVLLAEYDRSVD